MTASAHERMRASGANTLTERQVNLSMSDEAKSNLKVIARVKAPKGIKLVADYDCIVKDEYEYTLKVIVKF